MSDHFAAFSFVDRITELEPGLRARGTFAVPETLARFVAFYSPLVRKGKVEHRTKELARLRLAQLNECQY